MNDEVARLREREKNKTEFLAMASHDIANSVSTLNAAFSLISYRLKQVDKEGQLIAIAGNALRQIARLADDLVDWAAMERGSLRLEREWFEPGRFLEEAVRGFALRAATKGIRFEMILEPDLEPIHADRRRMTQVLMNLLENAIRHTPCRGAIAVGACSAENHLVIVVHDTGEGMDEKTRHDLEEGLQVEHPSGRLGLGLAIARAIVARHGGRLWVDSAGLDKGSTFTLAIESRLTHDSPQVPIYRDDVSLPSLTR